MTWTLWGWYVLTTVVASLSPGPAVLLVVAQALHGGRTRAFWTSLGILSVNVLFFGLSALGLGALLVASHRLFRLVKWIGAAYLVYVGIRTFAGTSAVALVAEEFNTEGVGAFAASGAIRPSEQRAPVISRSRTWLRGVALQLANPKALLFFTALLPQFIRARTPVPQQIAVLGVTSLVAEFCILATYGALAGRLSVVARQPRFVRLTNRVSGVLLIGAGTGIALVSEG